MPATAQRKPSHCGCGTPITGAWMCKSCTGELITDLRRLGAGGPDGEDASRDGLVHDLQVTITRTARLPGASQPRFRGPHEPPIPFHDAALDLMRAVIGELRGWISGFAAHAQLSAHVPATVGAACRWTAAHPRMLRRYPHTADMRAAVRRVVGDIERMVDAAPDLVYLGRCAALDRGGVVCGADLYAALDQPAVDCRTCGTRWDAWELWERLRATVRGTLATAAEIAAAAPRFSGRTLSAKTIRTWCHRDKVTPRACRVATREALLLVDDVLDYAERHAAPGRRAGTPARSCG